MRRRGNKSSKVPNVKLRPAEKGAISRQIEESCWAQDTQPGSGDAKVFDLCPRPFKGVVICATGVADKPTLFKQAVELGATCTPAFTDRVTHLVAVDHGGAKYTCALERKIPILKPSWISENYQIWLKGDDVDVENSVNQHRLPIMSGVVVCPSGITDITRRTQISKLVTQHQGQYLKNLERPVKVTHLLCSGDEETDKMCYAEKFNSRGEAKIHLVWEEWFWDSVDFGGRFDEATYQVRRPRPERKSLPAARSSPPPSSSYIGSQHDEIPSSSARSRPPSRPPQNNADEAEDEPAFVSVLPAVTLQLWGGLLERRGYQITDGEVILSPSKVKQDGMQAKHTTRQLPSSPVRPTGAGGSVISAFRRANSFAPAVPTNGPGASRRLPFRRTSTAAAAFGNNAKPGPSAGAPPAGAIHQKAGESSSGAAAGPSGSAAFSQIFAGKIFRALGEARSPNVRGAVEQLGGWMSTDEDKNVDFIIVRLVTGSKIYREEEDESLRLKYRTECWLEHCIYEDRICTPDENVSFVPLSIQIPVTGAENVVMSLSGFDQSESCGLKRLLRALGITLAPTFTRRSTHLLCPSGTGLKFDKAREWGVPVVDIDWLGAMASSGKIPQVHNFLVLGSVVPPVAVDDDMEVDRRDPKGNGKAVDKGKGRARSVDAGNAMDMEVENRMNDITNNSPPEDQPHASHPGEPPSKKTKAVERQYTTIIPNPEPPEKLMFGLPNETLGGSSFFAHPSSILTPNCSMATPIIQYVEGPRNQESHTAYSSRSGSFSENPHPNTNPHPNSHTNSNGSSSNLLYRKPTIPNLDIDIDVEDRSRGRQDLARVPSSKSPSPMKAPLRGQGSRLSLSPVKIDHEATKALQESITSLLGKRPSPDGDEVGANGGGAGGAGAGGRNGKRARPQRSKSRQTSDAKIGEPPLNVATKPKPKLRTSKSRSAPAAEDQADSESVMNPFGSYADEGVNLANPESQLEAESMRVMYEDPGQRDEKKRLMSLLKSQTGGEEDGTTMGTTGTETLSSRAPTRLDRQGSMTRRSTRIAGF